jgi:Glycosyl transferase family 11
VPAPKIVAIQLVGGLGNQMFQYAMARALALRNGADVKIDTRFYARQKKRRYELHVYPVRCSFLTKDERFRFGLRSKKRRRFYHKFLYRDWTVYRERHFHFDPAVKGLAPPVYLAGFWQTERYFHDIAEILRREFTPVEPLESQNAQIEAKIADVNAVSVHVRRGDYVASERLNRFHGTCSLDYYRRAAEFMRDRVDAPHFFVFSDDPEWVTQNLRFEPAVTHVTVNSPARGFRDLQLMSRCRHHIIANSSFSWWGAWLSRSPDKLVVAPKRWFNQAGHDTRDLLPEAWVKL